MFAETNHSQSVNCGNVFDKLTLQMESWLSGKIKE